MALTKCHECGNDVSTQAKACPKCGAKVKKPRRTHGRLWILLGALLAVSIIVGNITTQTAADEEASRLAALNPEQRAAEIARQKDESDLSSARFACRKFVEQSLHDPASAQFEDPLTYPAEKSKKDIYRVQVRLSAKNGFNATRKFVMDCRLKSAGSSWVLIALNEIK